MSQATPMSIEPPTPSAGQLAQWRALIERIRQDDRSNVLAWDEVAAGRPAARYQSLSPSGSTGGSVTHRLW
jgi:hypothetical protein